MTHIQNIITVPCKLWQHSDHRDLQLHSISRTHGHTASGSLVIKFSGANERLQEEMVHHLTSTDDATNHAGPWVWSKECNQRMWFLVTCIYSYNLGKFHKPQKCNSYHDMTMIQIRGILVIRTSVIRTQRSIERPSQSDHVWIRHYTCFLMAVADVFSN